MKNRFNWMVFIVSVSLFIIASPNMGNAKLLIQSETDIDFKLLGYNGLESIELFAGTLAAGGSQSVKTSYNGLAMLVFSGGQ